MENLLVYLNENWRGWKADAYEGGHRVPFIVRWPGHVEPGSRSDQTVSLADIMATCADVIGHELPVDAAEEGDVGIGAHLFRRGQPFVHKGYAACAVADVEPA